jgi:ubiquinone/menaquinone biosynthesis C-methylase UbiE
VSDPDLASGPESVSDQAPPLSKKVESHYLTGFEAKRLSTGQGELERVRTQAIQARYLPEPPAVILDVGGAAGVYAIPLARQGYRVHLVDPVPLHLEQAKAAAVAAGVSLAGVSAGDARRLDIEDGVVDAVLMLGPLYHLVERADRLLALREARRVLKPRGVLFAAAISRYASLIDGVAKGFFQDPAFRSIVAGDLATGQHDNPTNHPRYFTTAFFHRPEELSEEVYEAGFGAVQVLAVEGPVWSAAGFDAAWADPTQREKLLEFLELIEREPSVLGASAHVLAVARRPE